MEKEIKELHLPEEEQTDLSEIYWRVWDLVSDIVVDLETALLPERQSIAVTFFAQDKKSDTAVAESSPGYRVPRREGDPRGTLFLPSISPDSGGD